MNRIIAAAAIAAVAAMAAPAHAESAFEGFHVGASVGPTVGKFTASVPGGDVDLGSTGFGGAVALGYSWGFAPRWILDGEINVDYTKSSAEAFGTKIEQGVGFGGAVSLGYSFMRDVMAYGKLGYQSTQFKITGDSDKQDGGILVGAGVKFALTDALSMKLGYDWIGYSKISSTSLGADVTPTVSQFRVGVDYRFW